MFPEQNGVRPVTLHGGLVLVTERRVNGRVQGVTCRSGLHNLQTSRCRCNGASHRSSIERARAGRAGSDEAPYHLNQESFSRARPGGWVGVRFPMTWGRQADAVRKEGWLS